MSAKAIDMLLMMRTLASRNVRITVQDIELVIAELRHEAIDYLAGSVVTPAPEPEPSR